MKPPLVKRSGKLYTMPNGEAVELLECGHAVRPAREYARRARCHACTDAPAWKLRALGVVVDAAAMVSEGQRRACIAELEAQGIPVPSSLLEQRCERELVPVGDVPPRPAGRATVIEVGGDDAEA